MLDPRRLRVLREVAERGTLAAAAAALDYTPSAVSQQLAALEREIGTTLVERGPRGAALTEPGRVLARHAERILASIDLAEADVQSLAGLRAGLLRLGWFATAGATLMPRAIAEFRRRHPDVELGLIEADPDECAQRLREGELELALVYEFELVEWDARDLRQTDLMIDRLRVALPAGHRLASRARLRLSDLADEPWVQGVRRGSTAAILPYACRAAGFEPRIAFRTDDHLAMQGLVAAGVGVGLIPELSLPSVRSDIAVRPVTRPALLRRVRAALPPGRYESPAAMAMIDVLREVARA
jgi:DNA-binding transcriptional LysR family regulator